MNIAKVKLKDPVVIRNIRIVERVFDYCTNETRRYKKILCKYKDSTKVANFLNDNSVITKHLNNDEVANIVSNKSYKKNLFGHISRHCGFDETNILQKSTLKTTRHIDYDVLQNLMLSLKCNMYLAKSKAKIFKDKLLLILDHFMYSKEVFVCTFQDFSTDVNERKYLIHITSESYTYITGPYKLSEILTDNIMFKFD